MDRSVLMLNAKSSLEENDLSRVYSRFRSSSVPENAEVFFKKNEKVGSMAKSMLKHRIQSLTGKNIGVLEKELGVCSAPEGPGLDVGSLRKLSYWLIHEANGSMPPDNSSPGKRSYSSLGQQTTEEEDEEDLPQEKVKSKKAKRPSRHSSIHEASTMSNNSPLNKTALTKSSRRKTMNVELSSIQGKVDCRLQGEKPTQAMLDVASKRGGRSASNVVSNNNNTSSKKLVEKNVASRKPKTSFSGALSYPDGTRNEIFIANASPSSFRLDPKSVAGEVPSFPGAALCLIHTPEDWMSPEIYLAIESVVRVNHSRGLDKFLLLVKCDVDNAASTRVSLTARFTEHVQFLVLHSNSSSPEDEGPSSRFKLKETVSTYFLAYFFPGCEKEGSSLRSKMMRDDSMTNCISAATEEELENKIIDAFTEPGDWVLDLAGRGASEIILSAQKAGRNGIVIDDNDRVLEDLQEKAVKIADYHDKNFREVDGDIIQLK